MPPERGPLRLDASAPDFEKAFSAFLGRNRDIDENVDRIAADIVADVRIRGDAAVLEYTRKFDKVETDAAGLRVSGAEDRAFREWARKFSEQKRTAFSAGKLANAAHVFNQIFPVLCSAVLFGTYAWFRDLASKNGDVFKMSTGEFIAFNTTFTLILSSFLSLAAASSMECDCCRLSSCLVM